MSRALHNTAEPFKATTTHHKPHFSIAHVPALQHTAEPFKATFTHHKPHTHWEYPTRNKQPKSNEGPYTPYYENSYKYRVEIAYKICTATLLPGALLPGAGAVMPGLYTAATITTSNFAGRDDCCRPCLGQCKLFVQNCAN